MDYRGNISFVVAKEHVQQEYHPTVREISLDIGVLVKDFHPGNL
jgi:hypothetical protein